MRATYKTSRATGSARTFDVGPVHLVESVIVGGATCNADLKPPKHGAETPPPIADIRMSDHNGDVRFEFDVNWDEADKLVTFFTFVRNELSVQRQRRRSA